MPNLLCWRSISVVLPVIALLGAGPARAATPEAQAVLQTIESGTVPRPAIEALLAKANAGDAEAAEVAGRLFDRGIGVRWDMPTALRWYAAAAIGGSDSAKRETARLWRGMPPVNQRRAEALLARFFTDTELAGIGLGPVRRPTNQRSWMTHLDGADIISPAPAPPAVPAPVAPALVVPAVVAAPPVPVAVPPAPSAPADLASVEPQQLRIPVPPTKPALPGAAKAPKTVKTVPTDSTKTAMLMPKARKPQPPLDMKQANMKRADVKAVSIKSIDLKKAVVHISDNSSHLLQLPADQKP